MHKLVSTYSNLGNQNSGEVSQLILNDELLKKDMF